MRCPVSCHSCFWEYLFLEIVVSRPLHTTVNVSRFLGARAVFCSQAERISLLKQAVEKYGNGKKDAELTPCVVLGDKRKADA